LKKTLMLIGTGFVIASAIITYGLQVKKMDETVNVVKYEQTEPAVNLDELDTYNVKSKSINRIEEANQEEKNEQNDGDEELIAAPVEENDPIENIETEAAEESEIESQPEMEAASEEIEPADEIESDAIVEAVETEIASENQGIQAVSMDDFQALFLKDQIHLVKHPKTQEDFEAILLHMSARNAFTYSIAYDEMGFEEVTEKEHLEEILKAFDHVFNRYPEYMSFTNRLSYEVKGDHQGATLTLTLSSDTNMDEKSLALYRESFFKETVEIVNELQAQGLLFDKQSDRDKALVLFDWMVQNTEYDDDLHAESYTGYGVYANQLAVCQGYTAAYNALCKVAGLQVEGVGGIAKGEEHIWTRALFAGDDMYIDATWGDSYMNSDKSNYDFFMVNGKSLSVTHSWQ